jgi:uncharacterized damage-inducible protein DinB
MTTADHSFSKQALIDRLAAARNELLAALRALPAAARSQPVRVDGWSSLEIVGHVASWENRYITLVQQLINGEADKIEWISNEDELNAWNAHERLRKRDWSWDEMLRDLALLREELLWNLGWATQEQLSMPHPTPRGAITAADLLEGLVEHDREHSQELRMATGSGA